jgi:hypothetical protein
MEKEAKRMKDFLENSHTVDIIIIPMPSVILLHSPYTHRVIS